MASRNIGATLSLNQGNFFTNIKSAISGTNQLKSTLTNATGSASKFGNSMKSQNSVLSSLKTSILGAATAYISLRGAGELVTEAFSNAASLESYRGTLNAVMKDTQKAGEIMAWAVDFANKTPFETDSIVQATVRLQAYGINAQNVMTSVGNMAGVMNKDIMQAVEAVADAQTGELERLKEFGITKAQIVAYNNDVLRKGEIVNNKGQITDQAAFNSALFALMDERFAGGMEIQATSFSGLWSTVKGTFATSIAQIAGISATGEVKIGSPFDRVKTIISGVAQTLEQWAQDGTIDRISNAIVTGMTAAASWLTSAWNVAKGIYDFFSANWTLLSPIISTITSAVLGYKAAMVVAHTWTTLVTAAQGLWTIAVNLWNAANAGTFGVQTAMAAFRAKDILETGILYALYAKDAIIKGVHSAATWVQVGATTALTAGQWLLNAAFLASPIGWIVLGIGLIVGAFVLLWQKCEPFRQFFIGMWEGFKVALSSFGGFFKGVINGILSGINWLISKFLGGINGLIDGVNSISGAIGIPAIPHIPIPQIPMLWQGGEILKGGRVIVGERGAEVLDLPTGARVTPLDRASNTTQNTITMNIYVSGNTADEVINEIVPKLKLALANL